MSENCGTIKINSTKLLKTIKENPEGFIIRIDGKIPTYASQFVINMAKKAIKFIASLFNTRPLAFYDILFFTEPLETIDIENLLWLLLVFGTPIINLLIIFSLKDTKKNNWFKLFLRRKTLKEQQKVKELENKIKSKN